MSRKLVIVESPAKARTIGRILGGSFNIKASMGHVRDLPKAKLGVDAKNGFIPQYVIIPQRRKLLAELKETAKSAPEIYLATDPDREGEAISWHLLEATNLDKNKTPIRRVVFHEITNEAVRQAFKNYRSIDMNLVNAQQARRILDRLVGYKLSPLLWKKVQKGLSAGRVQSVAVRMVVDREREIENFNPVEYWTIEVELEKVSPTNGNCSFRTQFIGSIDGKKIELPDKDKTLAIAENLKESSYAVKAMDTKQSPRQPAPPFTTSTLQQEAWRRLSFTAKRTMLIAQQLYEGIEIGDEGEVGLITYMRTDSTHIAASALSETRDYIRNKYGEDYLPAKPRTFAKKSKWSQEAHEAVRPTSVLREPEHLRTYLKSEQFKLYELIWKRMVASQMAAALFDTTTVDVKAEKTKPSLAYLLRTTNSIMKFPGFMSLYIEGKDEDVGEEKVCRLPELKINDKLTLVDIYPEQFFTEPPMRYNEATLIKALEQKGIGRPSTYAPILSTIQERGYVYKEKSRFRPDDIGKIVNDLLVANFPEIVDFGFTAQMEENLDKIARGEKDWVSILKNFYTPFDSKLETAVQTIKRVNTDKPSDEVCPRCGRPMVIKSGRFGKFLACSGYPECKTTKPLMAKIGVPCPECGATEGGELVERVSKKHRRFYGCSRYPDCKFTTRQKPLPQSCPSCGNLLVVSRNNMAKCTVCKFKGNLAELEMAGAAT